LCCGCPPWEGNNVLREYHLLPHQLQ
jgi:hypothetical protein